MHRRIACLLLAALVLIPAIPAAAAEPMVPPATESSPEPTPTVEPTPEPTSEPTAEPSADPSPSADASPSPSPEPAASTDPITVAEPPTPLSELTGGVDPTGKYIVVLRSGTDPNTVVSHHRVKDRIQAKGTFTRAFRGFSATLSKQQRSALLADPNVTSVVPDELIHLTAQTIPTGVSRIGARISPVAKINGLDERVDTDVAIVDTGVSYHPDLNVAGGYNCTSSSRTTWGDANGHGTHVAGTVAALDNTIGVVGVAPGARIWAVRILNADGYGLLSWYVCGLDWILAQRDPNDSSRPLIEVANMSVAKDGADDVNCGFTNKDVLHQAICRLVAGGTTVVAAAANDKGSASKKVPAAYNEVITVSALADTDGKRGGLGGNRCLSWGGYDKDDTFADFSNYGSDVDLIAPGKCIWSTKPGNSYQYMSGTSMAAPAVTGAVALYKSTRPAATTAEVKEALQYLGTLDWRTSTDPDSYHEKLLDVSRLGPLGTFDLNTSALGYTNAHGGTSLLPVSIDRSSTFFERVRFSVTSLPSGWTASLGTSSLLGWTAEKTTITVHAPDPVPAGTYRVGISATSMGRTDTGTVTVVVDNDKPSVGAPYANLRAGSLGSSSVPVTLAWPFGSDPTSWVGKYEVETRLDSGAWTGHATTSATTRAITRTAALNRITTIRVRATDGAGNVGNWVQSPGLRPTVVDERSSAVRYTGTWKATTSSSAYGRTLRGTTTKGATATLSFTGRSVGVVFPTAWSRGSVEIWVDGALTNVVYLRTKASHSRQIMMFRLLNNGTHSVVVKTRGSMLVQLDGFVVIK